MKNRTSTLRRHASQALLLLASTGLSFAAAAATPAPLPSMVQMDHGGHSPPPGKDTAPLLEKVRRITERFRNINVALSEGWAPGTPCVSGPDAGAMGVHFLQPTGIPTELNVNTPAALIYEPMADGAMRFVGVEYIVIQSTWDANNSGPPVLEGNLLNLVGSPNRFGLPAFYELHVWAWANNPKGTFADWNTLVSCDRQPGGS